LRLSFLHEVSLLKLRPRSFELLCWIASSGLQPALAFLLSFKPCHSFDLAFCLFLLAEVFGFGLACCVLLLLMNTRAGMAFRRTLD
jgi:hypothetical protein